MNIDQSKLSPEVKNIIFVRPLFIKYQYYLTKFANTKYGRMYLSLNKWAKIKNNYRIIKVTPDGIHWFTGEYTKKGLPICQAVFFSKSPYLKKFRLALEGLEIASEFKNSFLRKPEFVVPHFGGLITPRAWLPLVMRTEETFNPDADPENTSVDGYVSCNPGDIAWATARSAADALSASDTYDGNGGTDYRFLYSRPQVSTYLIRGILLFDTSSLGSGATEVSGVLSITPSTLGAKHTSGLGVCACNPNSNTALAVGDYSAGMTLNSATEFVTRVAPAGFTANVEKDMTLNASGNTAISKTDITKFMCRTSDDLDNDEPTLAERNGLEIYYADYGSNKPKLVVTYTSGPAGVKTINELAIASVKTIQQTVIANVKTINNSAV